MIKSLIKQHFSLTHTHTLTSVHRRLGAEKNNVQVFMSGQKTGAGTTPLSDAKVSQSESILPSPNGHARRMAFEHAENGRDFVQYKSNQSTLRWAGLRVKATIAHRSNKDGQ